MIASIVRHEFVTVWRDGRFRWAALLVAGLFAAAVTAGWFHQRELAAQRSAADAAERARWLGQPEKNPHSAAHYGVYAFKPRLAPAFLDPGIEPYAGIAVWLEAHNQNDLLYKPAEDATAAQRFGDLTAALVLQLLLPLVVILVGFASVAGEREQGLLRQVLSLGLPPTRWLWGKVLGLAAAIGALVVPAVAFAMVVFALSTDGAVGADAWPRFALLVVVYLGYFALVLLITLAVSAWAPSARVALIVLLGGWIVQGLLVPRTVAEFAALRHPVPATREVRDTLRRQLGDPHGRSSELERKQAELMVKFNVSRPEDLPVNQAGLSLQASEEAANQVYDRVLGGVFDRIDLQNRWHRFAAWASPLAGVQALSLALAGTDFGHHRHFITAAEEHRRLMQRILNEDLMYNGPRDGSVYLAGPALWESIPPFDYRPPALSAVLRSQAAPLAALGAWLAAAGGLLILTGRRLNPL